jgi:predicted TIM-barrel fold metal-dependent hydrolase
MRNPIHGITHTAPDFPVPRGACDCHTHVFGPDILFPHDPARKYTPPEATTPELVSLHVQLGIDRVVIVHPSPYGADNRATLAGMRGYGRGARGVAVIDAKTITNEELDKLHAAGIRGVRVNLETGGVTDPAAAGAALLEAAARVAPLGWHVQTYTNLGLIVALKDVCASLPVPLVIDHFGRAQASLGTQQPGFADMLALVKSGKAYVKLSAPHRLGDTPDDANTAAIAKALIDANPERMLWGTDWPHPGGKPRAPEHVKEIEPFVTVDDGAALNRLARWAGTPERIKQILVDNPARLYDF